MEGKLNKEDTTFRLIELLNKGEISAQEAGAITIKVEANPRPSNKAVRCGFEHIMTYRRQNFAFSSGEQIFFAPNVPGYVCDPCDGKVRIFLKKVGDELIEKVEAIRAVSKNTPQT